MQGSFLISNKKSSLEKSRKFAQTLPEEEQYWNNETEKMKVGVINDASADYLTNLIENATLEYHNDAIISNIIQQEANEYFNYNLSVEETSKRIQNKVLIYLNETK